MKRYLLIFCLYLVVTSSLAENEDSSAVVDYRFSCNMEDGRPLVDSSQSSFLEDLVGLNSTICEYASNGVSSNSVVESDSSIALLQQHFAATKASGLTLEVWITPKVRPDDLSIWNPILQIGTTDDKDSCQGTDLALGLRGDLLEIRHAHHDPGQPCQTFLVRQKPLPNNKLVQIVFTSNDKGEHIYFNGEGPFQANLPDGFITNMTVWKDDSTLKLFSNQIGSSKGIGSLHQVSIYFRHFDADQIQWAYQKELQGKQDSLLGSDPLRLLAVADPVVAVQGRPSPIYLGGWNRSTIDYSVQLEITTLPRFGHILGDSGPIEKIGFRIPLPGTKRKETFFYRSWSEQYFTSPAFSYSGDNLKMGPEVLEYRLVALDRNDGSLVGWSDEVQTEIIIRHINHPPTLILPKMATMLRDTAWGVAARPTAVIGDIHLDDQDRNVDRVRVDIWALNGTVRIQDHLELADFSARTITSRPAWQCNGDPTGSSNMTFLAEPSSVSLILSSILYEGFFWNQEDFITIRIYDGSGGPCLEEEEHKYKSIHDACFEIVATLTVPAIAPSQEVSRTKVVWLVFLVLFLSIGMLLLYIKMCYKSCWNQQCSQDREDETDTSLEKEIAEIAREVV
eukprot:scaffold1869_cov122-Cylindrotheca_fusiformis.AAC.59